MTMTTRQRAALAAGTAAVLLWVAGDAALAKSKHGGATGSPKARGHHCEVHGTEVDKAKKDCRKAGGVWMDGPPHVTAQPTAPPPAAH